MVGYTAKGEKFLFDKEFYSLILQCTWSVGNHGYLQGQLNNKMCLMHRVITNCPANKQVDHINHNKLYNRLSNLRICTASHNQMNELLSKNNTNGRKGVSYNKRKLKWEAYINYNIKKIHLGFFDNLEDAVAARQKAEKEYFKEFNYKEAT